MKYFFVFLVFSYVFNLEFKKNKNIKFSEVFEKDAERVQRIQKVEDYYNKIEEIKENEFNSFFVFYIEQNPIR